VTGPGTQRHHTKIVATLGPATGSREAIQSLVEAGVDVFRLNYSHGTREEHARSIARIREGCGRVARPIAILQDLSGPKIRTGRLQGGSITLKPGETLRIATGDDAGGPGRVTVTFAALATSVKPGDTLLLDDGKIELRVEATDGREITTKVVNGGPLGEHKGISAPGVRLPASSLTDKDREDLKHGIAHGVDFAALSFVQTEDDLAQAHEAAAAAGDPELPFVAKIERPEALEHLEGILSRSQAVMVARGDLGLELPLERVPVAQKWITRLGREHGVPVIVATEVLDSMRTEPRPTRAEVSDAANAVSDSVDAIMLSGETAIGQYPSRAVATLDAIIREAEHAILTRDAEHGPPALVSPRIAREAYNAALCEAAVTLAVRAHATAIVAPTRSGHTARVLSALRPGPPIIAATADARVARRLMLHRGVVPAVVEYDLEADPMGIHLERRLVECGCLEHGSVVVYVNAHPDLARASANFLAVRRVA
jgi:pyruvate kinase